jgi:hypothetical protein
VLLDATYAGRSSRQLPSSYPGRCPLTLANDLSFLRLDAIEPQPFIFSPGWELITPCDKEWGQHTVPMVSQAHMHLFHMLPLVLRGRFRGGEL